MDCGHNGGGDAMERQRRRYCATGELVAMMLLAANQCLGELLHVTTMLSTVVACQRGLWNGVATVAGGEDEGARGGGATSAQRIHYLA